MSRIPKNRKTIYFLNNKRGVFILLDKKKTYDSLIIIFVILVIIVPLLEVNY